MDNTISLKEQVKKGTITAVVALSSMVDKDGCFRQSHTYKWLKNKSRNEKNEPKIAPEVKKPQSKENSGAAKQAKQKALYKAQKQG
jgi:hypothetical protein